jgi:hypothetical protein
MLPNYSNISLLRYIGYRVGDGGMPSCIFASISRCFAAHNPCYVEQKEKHGQSHSSISRFIRSQLRSVLSLRRVRTLRQRLAISDRNVASDRKLVGTAW